MFASFVYDILKKILFFFLMLRISSKTTKKTPLCIPLKIIVVLINFFEQCVLVDYTCFVETFIFFKQREHAKKHDDPTNPIRVSHFSNQFFFRRSSGLRCLIGIKKYSQKLTIQKKFLIFFKIIFPCNM